MSPSALRFYIDRFVQQPVLALPPPTSRLTNQETFFLQLCSSFFQCSCLVLDWRQQRQDRARPQWTTASVAEAMPISLTKINVTLVLAEVWLSRLPSSLSSVALWHALSVRQSTHMHNWCKLRTHCVHNTECLRHPQLLHAATLVKSPHTDALLALRRTMIYFLGVNATYMTFQ